MKRLFILGAGGHTKQVIDIFEMNNIKVHGIFDDNKPRGSKYYYDYEIIDSINNAEKYLLKDDLLFCGIGDNKIRGSIIEKFINYQFTNCISPLSIISKRNKMLGQGNYIGHYVNIMGDTTIGVHNIINDGTLVAHDVDIGDFNLLAPHCVFAGGTKIGNYNLIGINASIIPKIIIGNNNIIGAGSVIIKNVSENSTVVGNPGKLIKKN